MMRRSRAHVPVQVQVRGRVRVQARASVLAFAFAIALGAGCATAGSRPDLVSFRVQTNVPDATIWIDDHLAGTASDLSQPGQRLPIGFHRVEIRHPGYYSVFQEVKPKRGEAVIISAELHELVE
jgi:hypothetical protein